MIRRLIGQERLIRSFSGAVASGRVSHAYLIAGEAGSGKRTAAEYFAAMLLCESESGKPCGVCASCRRAAAGSHPDLIRVGHEKPGLISIAEIRSQLVDTAPIRPLEGGRKVYIVPDADRMNQEAQNALLKTLEEPPAYVVILLLATGPERLLPTIISRCVRADLMPVPDAAVMEYLREEFGMPDYEAKVVAAFAQGNIGRAKQAANDEAFSERREKTLALIKNLPEMNAGSVAEAAKLMAADSEYIDEILDTILLYFRDVLYYKAAAEVDRLVFAEEISSIRRTAAAASYEGLTEIAEAVDRCRQRLQANVNFELAAELLLFTIRENTHA